MSGKRWGGLILICVGAFLWPVLNDWQDQDPSVAPLLLVPPVLFLIGVLLWKPGEGGK